MRRSGFASGFTLVEAMISMVVLLIACLAMFQGIEITILQYASSQHRWDALLERWNDTELLRSISPRHTDTIWIIPNARPLYRDLVEGATPVEPAPWEVLRAER